MQFEKKFPNKFLAYAFENIHFPEKFYKPRRNHNNKKAYNSKIYSKKETLGIRKLIQKYVLLQEKQV